MSSAVIPLETPKELDDGWGQYVKIDMKDEPVSNVAYLTTSLVDLEEGNLIKTENEYEYIDYYCTIC
tara:strand:+ start:304 stop:504 length:201 start_codon:yes stop_codon:yes gene_type:complete